MRADRWVSHTGCGSCVGERKGRSDLLQQNKARAIIISSSSSRPVPARGGTAPASLVSSSSSSPTHRLLVYVAAAAAFPSVQVPGRLRSPRQQLPRRWRAASA